MPNQDLLNIRTCIDEIDTKIQDLINQRALLAKEVAQAKYAEENNPNFYRPERETEILHKIVARNQGILPNSALTTIFREIMSACLALQKPLNIAFLGPEGTFSQTAVLKHFGHAIQTTPVQTIEEVFREIETGNVQYGVVPVENSTEGGINQTLDCFIATPLKICGEIELPIHHHLLSKTPTLNLIQRIYSHQQSFGQCRLWLNAHVPSIEKITVNSNAEAARRAASEPYTAAIAGQTAAEIYQLGVLASHIEDSVNNTTRFVVLGKHLIPATGSDKTSLLLSAANKPGALYHLLKPFADNAISMTRIESRPSRQGVWEYVFFIDIEGHIEEESVTTAVQLLQNQVSLIKHLGSYPRAMR